MRVKRILMGYLEQEAPKGRGSVGERTVEMGTDRVGFFGATERHNSWVFPRHCGMSVEFVDARRRTFWM